MVFEAKFRRSDGSFHVLAVGFQKIRWILPCSRSLFPRVLYMTAVLIEPLTFVLDRRKCRRGICGRILLFEEKLAGLDASGVKRDCVTWKDILQHIAALLVPSVAL